jgi:ketosteroid isomerase-like protein
MRKAILVAAALACWPAGISAQPAAPASPADDATKFVNTIIDKFNAGDVNAWVSAQEDNTMIVDEFGPHMWSGAGSPKHWLDDYMKDSKANGVTGGRVDYGKPLQTRVDGNSAYLVLPVTYSFVAKGTKMAEPGNMTIVLNRHSDSWKIASWTYAATAAAAPAK